MALNESKNLHSKGVISWFSTLACLPDKYNIQIDSEIDIYQTATKLKSNDKVKWLERLHASDKLRTYRTFKTTHNMESYLISIKDIRKRALISRMRISAHTLEIEVGRHKYPKTPADQRFCKKCSTVVEDEKHFIIACPAYSSASQPLISYILTMCPNFGSVVDSDKLIWLMTADDPFIIAQLANFIGKASNIRCTKQI